MPKRTLLVQTTVQMDDWFENREVADVKTAMHIAVDPVTKIKECSVYTDDGRGYGVLIFKFEM
jgi:hypothetical protein